MDLNQTLRSIAIFQNLSDSELDEVSRSFEVRDFRPQTMIFKQNDPGEELFVIAEGGVQIFVVETDRTDFLRPEGREKVLCTLKPGDYFGEIAVLGNEKRTTSARTVAATRTWVLQRDLFESLILKSPKMALQICRALASYLNRTNAKPLDLQRLC